MFPSILGAKGYYFSQAVTVPTDNYSDQVLTVFFQLVLATAEEILSHMEKRKEEEEEGKEKK